MSDQPSWHQSDDGRAILQRLRNNDDTLTTLNLSNNSINSDGAKALADALKSNTALTTLNLSNNSIHDLGAVALACALSSNQTLDTLKLGSSSIRDKGAKFLIACNSLKVLCLAGNSITTGCLMELANKLKSNKSLEELDVSRQIKAFFPCEPPQGLTRTTFENTLKRLHITCRWD
jgi:Ran GTPase-activating protein (RanGAP) involved in mRNA processing and transport